MFCPIFSVILHSLSKNELYEECSLYVIKHESNQRMALVVQSLLGSVSTFAFICNLQLKAKPNLV